MGDPALVATSAQALQVIADGMARQVQALLAVKERVRSWSGCAASAAIAKLEALAYRLGILQGAMAQVAGTYATYGQNLAGIDQRITSLQQQAQQAYDDAQAAARSVHNMYLRREIMDDLNAKYRWLQVDYDYAMSAYYIETEATTSALHGAARTADTAPDQ